MKEIRARDPARRMVLRYRVPRQEDCSRIRLIPLILEQAALRFAQVLTKIHGFVAKSKWTNPNSRKFDQLPSQVRQVVHGSGCLLLQRCHQNGREAPSTAWHRWWRAWQRRRKKNWASTHRYKLNLTKQFEQSIHWFMAGQKYSLYVSSISIRHTFPHSLNPSPHHHDVT